MRVPLSLLVLAGAAFVASATIGVLAYIIGKAVNWFLDRRSLAAALEDADLSDRLRSRIAYADYEPAPKLDPVEFAELESLLHHLAKDDPDWARKYLLGQPDSDI